MLGIATPSPGSPRPSWGVSAWTRPCASCCSSTRVGLLWAAWPPTPTRTPATCVRPPNLPRSTSRSPSEQHRARTLAGVVGRFQPSGRAGAGRTPTSDRGGHRSRVPTTQPARLRRAMHHHKPQVAVPPGRRLGPTELRHVRPTQVDQPTTTDAAPPRATTARGDRRDQIRVASDDRHKLIVPKSG